MNKIKLEALTFDDVLILPDHSNIIPSDAILSTNLTKNIKLNIPVLSSAMDTVTESAMAISIARLGGIGIIHKNLSIEQQAEEIKKVKKFESAMVANPITIKSSAKIRDLIALTKKHQISGVPVCENNELIGIVTSRDYRFITNYDEVISKVMTPKNKLITALENTDLKKIKQLLHTNRIEKILIVDKNKNLKGIITATDIKKTEQEPNSCKNKLGQLCVGAAIGVNDIDKKRAEKLLEQGADVLVVDTAHGHSQKVLDQVKWLKANYKVEIIGGNIATGDAAMALEQAGVDAVKVGIGPGSICTTRIVSGVGVPQISAILEVSKALGSNSDISIIADGGIRYSGDIAKALVAGANCVMLGNLLAGTKESPGEMELYQGRSYKSYRGMGSIGAMEQRHGSSDRYFQNNKSTNDKLVPEGVEGRVPYKGKVSDLLTQLNGGVRSSMGYTGCKSIKELHKKARFCKISASSIKESHVHNVAITKEPPNYQI